MLLIATIIFHKLIEATRLRIGNILKLNGFLINCFSLFIIPSTQSFSELIQEKDYNLYHTIITYVLISLVLPIALILTMILSKHPDLEDTYRKTSNKKYNLLHFLELIDIIKQVAFAICAAFDIIWACLAIEIAWVILIAITHPYNEKSSYPLVFGSSAVIIISNIIILASKYKSYKPIGFEVSIIIVVLAIIPAIVAFYIFIFYDFKLEIDAETDLSIEKVSSIHKMALVANIIAPLAFICYGMFLPFFIGNIKVKLP